MKERPILFSSPMVRAILSGTKTQTRRLPRRQPLGYPWLWEGDEVDPGPQWFDGYTRGEEPCGAPTEEVNDPMRCPYGAPGDRLWVREAWRTYQTLNHCPPSKIGRGAGVQYEAGGSNVPGYYDRSLLGMGRLRPGMFMPRWASRITLEVESVRVERLQEITDSDAEAEGVLDWAKSDVGMGFLRGLGVAVPDRPRFLFRLLWLGIHGAESWDASPYVWVVSFKRVEATP